MNSSRQVRFRETACLVLAAGGSSRFGGRKQLADLAGRPLLEHSLEVAARSPVERVVVVLGAHADEIRARIEFGNSEVVVCAAWADGISAALRTGVEAVADADAAVVVLGDQPLVSAAAITRVLANRRPDHSVIRATYAGQPGHPVALERRLFGAVSELRGDAGARQLLAESSPLDVPCEDIADPLDVDTAEDLRLAELKIRGVDTAAVTARGRAASPGSPSSSSRARRSWHRRRASS